MSNALSELPCQYRIEGFYGLLHLACTVRNPGSPRELRAKKVLNARKESSR